MDHGILGTVAGGQGDQVVVGRVASGESGLGRGGSDHGLPQEGVVQGAGVDGVSIVGVVGVELSGCSVSVDGVVAEVRDGGEAASVAVLQRQHAGVGHDVPDLVSGDAADGLVGVHDLDVVHGAGDVVDSRKVHGVLVGDVRPDVAVRVGVGVDLGDGHGGVVDVGLEVRVDVGVVAEAGREAVDVVGHQDAHHHRGDRSAGTVGQVHVGDRGGASSEDVGDGLETALGDRVVGVVDPGGEGAVLVHSVVLVPEVPDGVGVACLDRVVGVSGEVVVGIGVVRDTGVHGEREVRDDDEQRDDDDGCEGEGLDQFPEGTGESGDPDGVGPVPEVGCLQYADDDHGGSDCEDGADDSGVGVGGPDREEHHEHPDGDEQPGGGVVLPEVDVCAVDGVAYGQPHGQPAVVGGDVGHGDVAACELVHDRVGVHAVAVDERREQVGGRDGEHGGDDDEHDDECGDRDDPGLGAESHEHEREHDGDDRYEDGSGVDGVPEPGGHVVGRGDERSDEDRDDVSEEDVLEVPSPEAVDDDLDDHRDDHQDDEEAESVPCEGRQGQEDSGEDGVDENALLGCVLGIGRLDHLDREPGREGQQEGRESVLGSAGEDRGADGEGQEREHEGCDDADPLVEHLPGDEEHGDAGERTDHGVQGRQGRGSGLGDTHPGGGEHGCDSGSDEVHQGRIDVESSDRIVDGRIGHRITAVQDTFNHMQVILRTRTARQRETAVGGDTISEDRAQREGHEHDYAERERTPVVL